MTKSKKYKHQALASGSHHHKHQTTHGCQDRTTNSLALRSCICVLLIASLVQAQTHPELDKMLQLFELSGETIGAVGNNDDPNESEPLRSALAFIQRVPRHKRLDWQQSDVDWSSADVNSLRGSLVTLQGTVKRVNTITASKQTSLQLGRDQCFACEVALPNNQLAILYANSVPEPLLRIESDPINQRISCSALVANRDENKIILIADALAWHPNQVDEPLGVTAAHVWMANQGVDIASIFAIRDNTALETRDRQGFYQLLAAAYHWDEARLKSANVSEVDVTALLKDLAGHRVKFYRLRGNVRRAVPILVDDRDIQALYGIRRYYEMEVFVEPAIPIVVKTKSGERRFGRYPVVFCCRELPVGMPSGENVNEPVEITGAFLKAWAYPSAWMQQQTGGDDQLQSSPLLIGRAPVWLGNVSATRPTSVIDKYGAWVFGVVLATIIAAIAWTARGDKKAREQRKARFDGEGANFEGMDPSIEE